MGELAALPVDVTTGLPGRVRRLAVRPAYRLRGAARTRAAARHLRRPAPAATSAAALRDLVTVVSSYRIDNEDRLHMLEATVGQLGRDLEGTGLRVLVADASPDHLVEASRSVWLRSGLDVEHHRRDEPMLPSLLWLLDNVRTPFFLLQFEDMLTAGLDASYLRGAVELLAEHGDRLGVVCPFWPSGVDLQPDRPAIAMHSHSSMDDGGQTHLRFRGTGPLRPTAIEVHDGLRFAIVPNFTYGFFLNALVAPVADYRRRLQWFATRADTTSVHAVELLAAPKLEGPWWTHLAICLDGVSLLDIDFAHTDAAVRVTTEATRALADAVHAGWPIVVVSDEDGR